MDAEQVALHIGKRLRARRRMLGLTQCQLAGMIGVKFQQIQKYECAANSISAGRLWALATSMGVGVEYFFDGMPRPAVQQEPTLRAAE
jgi:transcriptional regulator with XRE-family HTH domain